MDKYPLPRLDKDPVLNEMLQKYCRIKRGEIWEDKETGHIVGCTDVSDSGTLTNITNGIKPKLAVQDPPYNLVAFKKDSPEEFVDWCRLWVEHTWNILDDNAALYIWLGADQNNNFEPFARFILMMGDTPFTSKSFITMRNQRGYGTQKNWMSIRQELLYYAKGSPVFNTGFVYTDIPKILRGYYKNVGGVKTENIERSKSETIRAGNVWVDIQQVFFLMEENVNGCFAQKPLKSIERIINVSSNPGDYVIDFFAHAGTTLLASERTGRNCFTIDIEPVYCEISIRRLENYRKNGKTGWQNSNPFKDEILADNEILDYLSDKYNFNYK